MRAFKNAYLQFHRYESVVEQAFDVTCTRPPRRQGDSCDYCCAGPEQWCAPDCVALDLGDYR